MRPLLTLVVAVALLAATAAPLHAEDPNPTKQPTLNQLAALKPTPDLGPLRVVQIQVGALARNDQPTKDAGIAIVYRFASPANRSHTGPLPRFTGMVREGYGVMLNHTGAQFGTLERDGDHAAVNVVLVGRGGEQAGFRFYLSRQSEGIYKGCWMTDAVVPFEVKTI